MASEFGSQSRASIASTVNREFLGLYRRVFGGAPAKARTTVTTNHLVVALEDVMLPAELLLVENGKVELVERARRTLHDHAAEEATSIVEQTLSRKVRGHIYGFAAEFNMATEYFILEPVHEDGSFGMAVETDN